MKNYVISAVSVSWIWFSSSSSSVSPQLLSSWYCSWDHWSRLGLHHSGLWWHLGCVVKPRSYWLYHRENRQRYGTRRHLWRFDEQVKFNFCFVNSFNSENHFLGVCRQTVRWEALVVTTWPVFLCVFFMVNLIAIEHNN